MGRKTHTRLIILACMLIATFFWIYRPGDSPKNGRLGTLQEYLKNIVGYEVTENIMPQEILQSLEVDDYASLRFHRESQTIELFVGYYANLEKLSAAHSPLVCFPSQGWTIGQATADILDAGDTKIHFMELEGAKGNNNQLILYWYQAHNSSSTQAYRNKFKAFLNKFLHNRPNHSLVRVTIPFHEGEREQARNSGIRFMQVFYKEYLLFLNSRG